MSNLPGWSYDESPFHAGEQSIQCRLGIREKMEAHGRIAIRNCMTEQQQTFYQNLPFVLVGSLDQSGQPWASVLTNQPGFMHALDERQLRIDAMPAVTDPLHANLHMGAALGLLGIEPPTRRRNRVNGMVSSVNENGLTVAVQRSFGNCPKYIQARAPSLIEASIQNKAGNPLVISSALDTAQQSMIRQADTFYIASVLTDTAATTSSCPHRVDVSHRGGKPGFVRVDDANTLIVPDFAGNNYFNTLGNLLLQPRAGLLFIDFEQGDLLYVAAQADIVWDGAEVAAYTGAQRLLRLHVSQTRLIRQALPLRWSEADYSPFLQTMGSWVSCTQSHP